MTDALPVGITQTRAMLVLQLAVGIMLLLGLRQFHIKLLPFSSILIDSLGENRVVTGWCSGAPNVLCVYYTGHKLDAN